MSTNTLFVQDASDLAVSGHAKTPVNIGGKLGAGLSVAVGGSNAVSSAAIGAGMRWARLYSQTDCRIAWGANPDATNATFAIQGGAAPEIVPVNPGDKFAAITM